MAKTAILAIRIITDAKNAIVGVDAVNTSVGKFEGVARKANVAAGIVTAGLVAMAKQAGDAASALEQSTGGVEVVFGDQAEAVKKLAAGAADAVGLSRNSYQQLATSLGGQLKGLGIAGDQVVGTTEGLIKTAADLAATYGGTTADAVQALGSLFRGEADPIERYNVFIKQSDVNARLASQGLDKLEGSALKQAETQARLAMVTEQTSVVNGQFASEANTAAGSSERFNAQLENAQAALGTALLPALTLGAQILGQFASWVEQNSSTAQFLAVVLGTVAVSMMAVNLAMSLNPIGLVIIAVAGLIAGIVWLIAQLGGIENVLAQMGNWWRGFIGWINDAAKALGDFLGLNNQAKSSGGSTPSRARLAAVDPATAALVTPRSVTGLPAPKDVTAPGFTSFTAAPMALSAPSLQAAASTRASTAGAGAVPTVQNYYEFTVQGALDRRGVAEEIRALLDELARSRGEKIGAGGIRR